MTALTNKQVSAERPVSAASNARIAAAQRRRLFSQFFLTFFAVALLAFWLMPLAYGGVTSLKTKEQISDVDSPILPAKAVQFEYEGELYDIYEVPLADGSVRDLALTRKGRQDSDFLDPNNPEAGVIIWEGRWRTLDEARVVSPTWSNYPEAFETISFMRILGNTIFYAGVGMFGAVISAAFVAYGFARFKFPGRNVLFIILLSTIILPPQVTLVPTYAFWVRLGFVGTWWPLLLPTFFANAYNVFFLRQYFMTIPREMEEAAKIDGAGPLRTFFSVILPQSGPALVAISLFHFFFAWNDFFGPLIYLAGEREKVPISVGLTFFNGIYASQPQLIQAASMMSLVIPVILFFLAQRYFIQGIVITGNK